MHGIAIIATAAAVLAQKHELPSAAGIDMENLRGDLGVHEEVVLTDEHNIATGGDLGFPIVDNVVSQRADFLPFVGHRKESGDPEGMIFLPAAEPC